MVKSGLRYTMMIFALVLTQEAWALLPQTANDLERLKDFLRDRLIQDTIVQERSLPMLLAVPLHHWEESREDFSEAVLRSLEEVMQEVSEQQEKIRAKVIVCGDCDLHRIHVTPQGSTVVNNGPLSLSELSELKKQSPAYQEAKSIAFVKETPAGVSMKVMSLSTGELLFFALADSTQRLSHIQPSLNYAREYDRRKRGEAILHGRLNMGFYPSGTFQLEFLEQWGDLNQHITGLGISFINPTMALGINYKFLPEFTGRSVDFGASIYMSMTDLLSTSSKGITNAISLQTIATYTIGSHYGVFGAITLGSSSAFSVGLSFYNPIFLPFIL